MKLFARLWKRFAPECVSVALLVLALAITPALVPRFFDIEFLFNRSTLYMEAGFLTLAMTLVIVAGHIDLSITSILALVGAIIATLHAKLGIPLGILLPFAPILGAGLGWVNGVLVAKRKLPSLVVTLATMALYRGGAQILLGDQSVAMPRWFVGIEKVSLPGTYFHLPLILLIVAAVGFGLLLHRTVFGRYITTIGVSRDAAHYSGVPTEKVLTRIFVLSGATAGVAAVLLLSRLGVARYDHARGLELDVITAVVLGGTSILGGRGTIFGSLVALLLIATLQTGMGVAGVTAETQMTAVGVLLIFALLLAKLTQKDSK